MSIDRVLSQAIAEHEAGRLEAAEAGYRSILAQNPNHAGALNLLGTLECQRQKYDQGIPFIRQALAIDPNWPEACSNLGSALNYCQLFDEAARWLRKALEMRPEFPEALNNLGTALRKSDPIVSLEMCRRAIGLRPSYAEAHLNIAKILLDLRRFPEAIESARMAVLLVPQWSEAHEVLGVIYEKAGRHDEAVAAIRQALKLSPASPRLIVELASLTGDTSLRNLPPDFVRSLFDEYAPQFDKHLVEQLKYRGPEALYSIVTESAPDRAFDIFDLGCGTGLCGVKFRPLARKLAGVDLSPAMVDKARAAGVYDELEAGDLLESLRKHTAAWDLLVAADVFVYFGDLDAILAAGFRALRPGGLFCFSLERFDGTGFTFQPNKRRFAHSRMYVDAVVAAHGFELRAARDASLRTEGNQNVRSIVYLIAKA